MNGLLERLPIEAKKRTPEWRRFYTKNKKRLEKMDGVVHELHHAISANTECLECANCCRTLGPRITDKDAERIAKALNSTPGRLFATHLRTDEDGDMVFRSMPCPFLDADNYCTIYEVRPKACREYPHTDRKRFFQIYALSMTNASTCPIVFEVLEQLPLRIGR